MTDLAVATPMTLEIGDKAEYPLISGSTGKVFEGCGIGLIAANGYARSLVAGDVFLGHCFRDVDNTDSVSGAKNVVVRTGKYRAKVTLASIALTDVGKTVYMSDDGTYTLTEGSNSAVGKVHRYVTTNTCIVEFEALLA